jgi:hypothetical protein
MIIDIKFGRENYGSISCNCDRKGLESLDVRTDQKPNFTFNPFLTG